MPAHSLGEDNEACRRGLRFFQNGQPRQAIRQLEDCVEAVPDHPVAHKVLGLCLHLVNEPVKAEDALLQACKLNPRDPDGWFFLGRLYYTENFFDKALSTLERARGVQPQNFRIHYYLAHTLEARGEPEKALAEFREAVKWNQQEGERFPELHLSFGTLLSKLNRLDESREQLGRAAELSPESWKPHYELAKVFRKQGDHDAAISALNSALKTGTSEPSETAQIYHLLMRVYYDMGRDEDARRSMEMWKQADR